MDGDAVGRISELAVGHFRPFEVDGVHYVGRTCEGRPSGYTQVVPKLHPPTALGLRTLEGLAGYLDANRDGINADEAVVHVVSPTEVEVVSGVKGARNQRFTYADVECRSVDLADGQYRPVEELIIRLNTLCTADGDRDHVVGIVGNIRSEHAIHQQDDGFTQEVTVRGGVAIVDEVAVENPVSLAPYRTFREVQQPVSPFVLRFKGGDGQPVTAALFEADGGTWELEAVEQVRKWLTKSLGNEWVVIA